MADAQPTIRYTQSAGKPVIEVAGTWTVFSLRGIRRTADKALPGGGRRQGQPHRRRQEGSSGSTPLGALEILLLAGGGPMPRSRPPRKSADADLFKVVQDNMCEAPPKRHVELGGALAGGDRARPVHF